MPIDPRRLLQLTEFDTPTICNAIELFDVRKRDAGYMDARIRAAFRGLTPMVGFASTAIVHSCEPISCDESYGNIELQLAHIQQLECPAVIVYQDLDEPALGATVGEVMCNIYRASGAVGLVTSGAARDLGQIEALQFPLFSSGTIVSHAYCRIVDVGETVQVGGLNVSRGDLLHGDENGVTTIPIELVDELPDVAREYTDAERIVIEYAQTGQRRNADELLERRRAMRDALAALKRRVAQ